MAEPQRKQMWLISYATSMINIFLFLDVLTLKHRIIIIILPTNRPEIILLTASTTKN